MTNDSNILQVAGVSHAFGGFRVLKDVEMSVPRGSITSLIGPNGSGKTTLFNVVSGFLRPSSGTIVLDGSDVSRLSVAQRSNAGLMRTFQAPQLFPDLTVAENVALGIYKRDRRSALLDFLLPLRGTRENRRMLAEAQETLDRHGMAHLSNDLPGSIPAGLQRNVELVRAAISEPKVLLLDEPSSGLTPEEVREFIAVVRQLNSDGTSILLVSHDMGLVSQLATNGYVLSFGEMIAHDHPKALQDDPRVREVYLGSRHGGN